MLAKIAPPTNDFLILARYLVHGRERPPSPDRVAWVLAHNLPTDDPDRAAVIMAATAEQSHRCRTAAYHLMISWGLDEMPTPEIMQEIAVKTLGLAGLAEHQALIMGHGDKPHRHLHMLINRVHPETGHAWSTSHDYRRFDTIMRQLSEEYGFAYVPAHSFNPELTDDLPKGPSSRAHWAARRGARTDRPQWSKALARAFGARLSERLTHGSTWEDLEMALAENGLALEQKGEGFVASNAGSYVKLSALGLTATAKGFEKRFDRFRSGGKRRWSAAQGKRPPRRSIWTVDAVDIARAIGGRDDYKRAVQEAARQRKARLLAKPIMDQLMAELAEALKASTNLTPARRRPKRPARPPTRRRRPTHDRER